MASTTQADVLPDPPPATADPPAPTGVVVGNEARAEATGRLAGQ